MHKYFLPLLLGLVSLFFLSTPSLAVVPGPAESVTLSPSVASPATAGTDEVVFTAEGTGDAEVFEYQFFLDSGSGWVLKQPYSTVNTWSWDTSLVAAGSYRVCVYVRNEGSSAKFEAYIIVNYTIQGIGPADSVTLSPSVASPATVGTDEVVITAEGTGDADVFEYQFYLDSGSGWVLKQPYSTVNTWSWDTSLVAAGSYRVCVYVRNEGSVAKYEAYKIIDYVIEGVGVGPAESATLSPSVASPATAGTDEVVFTSAGTGDADVFEYQYFLDSGSGWVLKQPYSTVNTWSWDTSLAAAGSYRVCVYVRNEGSSAKFEAYKIIDYSIEAFGVGPAESATLSPSVASPATAGTDEVVFTSEGTGDSDDFEYQFYLDSGSGWVLKQPYSTVNTWSWDTSLVAAGSYRVCVYVRNGGSVAKFEAYKIIDYVIEGVGVGPAESATLSPSVSSPVTAGITEVVFTAEGTGDAEVFEYQFYLDSGSGWVLKQPYSTVNSWTWDTSLIDGGVFRVCVYVRNEGSVVKLETYKLVDYTINAVGPTESATLSPSVSSPVTAGIDEVVFTAEGTGDADVFEYQFFLDSGSGWVLEQPYSTVSTWNWDTSSINGGNFRVCVYVRNEGSVANYETYKIIDYVVSPSVSHNLEKAFEAWASAETFDPETFESDIDSTSFLDAADNFIAAKSYVGVDASATASVIDQARFFGSVAALAKLADPYSDMTDNGLVDLGDLLDAFGVAVSPRDTFGSIQVEDCTVDPDTFVETCTLIELDPESPTSGEVLEGLRLNMINRLQAVVDGMGQVSSEFNFRYIVPGDVSETEFDYADALLVKAIAQGMIAQLDLLLAYNMDVDIYNEDALANDLDDTNDGLDAFLARNPTLFSLSTGYLAYLADAQSRLSSAADAMTASINAIDQEIGDDYENPVDAQSDELFSLDVETCYDAYNPDGCGYNPFATEYVITEALDELALFKSGLTSAVTDDGGTPEDPTDDLTLSLYKFFNGIDIRGNMPAYDSASDTFGMFPDATMGGIFNTSQININEDVDGDGNPDIVNGYTKFFEGFLFPEGTTHNGASQSFYWGDGSANESFNFSSDGTLMYYWEMWFYSPYSEDSIEAVPGVWHIDSVTGDLVVELDYSVNCWRSATPMNKIIIDLFHGDSEDLGGYAEAEVETNHFLDSTSVNNLGPVSSSLYMSPYFMPN